MFRRDGKLIYRFSNIDDFFKIYKSWKFISLPQFIEESSYVWTKLSIPANSSKSIYVYYNSNSSEVISNGDEVFEFFDDFEEELLDTKWQFNDGQPWTTTTTYAYHGSRSACNVDISDGQAASMVTSYTPKVNGTLVFYYKVSSESNYDFLRYILNGSEIWHQSGEVSWTRYEQSLTANTTYTIKFKYTKDGSVSRGADAGFIDLIYFQPDQSILSISYSDEETGNWTIDGITYTKRKKVIITNNSNENLIDYQIRLDLSEFDNNISVRVGLK